MVRHFVEMLVDVLEVARAGPITKTHLTLRSRLSSVNATLMFKFLVERGFLELVEPIRTPRMKKPPRPRFLYRLTVAGNEILKLRPTVENAGILYEYSRWKRERK